MSMLTRRGLITGLVAVVAAPAVIRTPGLLMPVRNIAATGWMLDPVAMAASCVASLGTYDRTVMVETYHPAEDRRGYAYKVVTREITSTEAERRVRAYINDPMGYEFGRTNTTWAPKNPPRLDRLRPASAFA